MKKVNNLGVWMDHSSAHLMDLKDDFIESETIESSFTHEKKAQTLSKSEKTMHNKENNELSDYYKKLENIIINYDDVILFGPTKAKTELYNEIRTNKQFDKIKINILPEDKMTRNQQLAFVKEYFGSAST